MKYVLAILAALMLSFSPAMAQWHHGGFAPHIGPGFHGPMVGPAWNPAWHGGGWHGGFGPRVGPAWGPYYGNPCWKYLPIVGWTWTC